MSQLGPVHVRVVKPEPPGGLARLILLLIALAVGLYTYAASGHLGITLVESWHPVFSIVLAVPAGIGSYFGLQRLFMLHPAVTAVAPFLLGAGLFWLLVGMEDPVWRGFWSVLAGAALSFSFWRMRGSTRSRPKT